MMKRLDFSMSHVMKKRCLILSVQSSSDDRDESTCLSDAFNVDRYNSPDEGLKLNSV